MLPDERFRRILEIIRKKQSVTVQELVKQIGISESTVRRDLAALDKKVCCIRFTEEPLLLMRDLVQKKQSRRNL